MNNGKVLLYVPHDKWVKRLLSYNALKIKYDKQNGNKEVWEPGPAHPPVRTWTTWKS